MAIPTIKIHNVESGEVIERNMTELEIEQLEIEKAKIAALKEAEEKAINDKQQILDKLGITETEAKLLLS